MANPDPYLKPGLTPSTDVELYESAAAGGTTTPISASTFTTGVAAESHEFIAGSAPAREERSIGAGYRRRAVAHRAEHWVYCRGEASVRLTVDRSGRRRRDEEELLLVGAL